MWKNMQKIMVKICRICTKICKMCQIYGKVRYATNMHYSMQNMQNMWTKIRCAEYALPTLLMTLHWQPPVTVSWFKFARLGKSARKNLNGCWQISKKKLKLENRGPWSLSNLKSRCHRHSVLSRWSRSWKCVTVSRAESGSRLAWSE